MDIWHAGSVEDRQAAGQSDFREGSDKIDLVLIPFAMRRSDGEMIDVHSVKRGLECDCICPSCKTPMIARQGDVLVWHFAHETRQGGAESVCKYSALVSIRLMAHQILARIDKIRVPPRPRAGGSFGRKVTLDSIDVDVRFEGQKVDAVAMVKETPLVIYMTYKSRPVPALLSLPANRKAGVLRIDLPFLWQRMQNKAVQQFDRRAFERALVDEVAPKKWIYHPARVADQCPSNELPGHEIRREQESDTRRRPPDSTIRPADNSPLLLRFECEQCHTTWFAGSSELDANICHKCARATGVRIA